MIYTFYSFKGGVGRSMALANIAEVMYRRGLNVLMVDFDLEAPGLERYFEADGAQYSPDVMASKRGVIDLLVSYKNLRSLPALPAPNPETAEQASTSSAQAKFPFPVEPLSNFIVPIYERGTGGGSQAGTSSASRRGSLSIIPAGRRDGEEFARYAERVRSFGWDDFFANWDGELFFDWFHEQASARADVVLIDSRTGVTEMSGVCTYQLADVVVMFVAPNHQNLNGIQMMATSLANPQLSEERGRPLLQLFVPSRVESGEGGKLDQFAERYNQALGGLLPKSLKVETSAFIDLKIPYVPYYAFIEDVAVREPDKPKAADMVKAFEKITAFLAQLAPSSNPLYKSFREEEKNRPVSTERLVRIAEDTYARFTPEERELARRALVRMVRLAQLSDNAGDTRSPVNMKDFNQETQRTVRTLADAHLITIETGKQQGNEIVQLTDEDLIHKWERLENWLYEDREFLLWRQQIRANIDEWETRARRRDSLLRGARLKVARQWQNTRLNDLSSSEDFYIKESVQAQTKRRIATALGALVIVALFIYPIYTVYNSYLNEQQQVRQQKEIDAAKFNDMANAAASKGDYDSAVTYYTQVISLKPESADAYLNRGKALLKQGANAGPAIDDFNQALRLNPHLAEAYLNRGIARMRKGENDNAIADYNQAVRLNPTSIDVYLNRGAALLKKGETDQAMSDYTEAIRLTPQSAEAYFGRGNVHKAKDQTDNAIADYTQALKLNSQYAEAYYARGNSYLKKGDGQSLNNSIADFSAALRGMPQNAEVLYYLGSAYMKKGDKKNAAAYLKDALKNSEDKNLNSEIGQTLLELGVASPERALIFLEYNDTKDFDIVSSIGIELRAKGYTIEDAVLTSGETNGDVRYFNADDKQNAENIAQVVRDRLAKARINLKMPSYYVGDRFKAKPGTIEVWFPSLPEAQLTRTGGPRGRAKK